MGEISWAHEDKRFVIVQTTLLSWSELIKTERRAAVATEQEVVVSETQQTILLGKRKF